MSGVEAATADVVRTHEEAASCRRPPLLITEPLEAFLDLNSLGAGPLEAFAIGEGHSNVTYLIRREGAELVLRRPPRPPLPPSAHDMIREAALLRALEPTPARVPRVLAVCHDLGVIGVPFFVMERIHGDVVTAVLPPSLSAAEARRRAAEEVVDALVEVHAVDLNSANLHWLGREQGYLERQCRRFGALWKEHQTRELPALDRVACWLTWNMPTSGPATVVHGDYRLGNLMLAPHQPIRVAAIFDWEMSTIGDPLADLGYLCATWSEPGDPLGRRFDLSPVTREPGFLDRRELLARYEERSGRRLANTFWYEALALWKAAIFMEGNYKRALAGATDDPFLATAGECVEELAERAEQIALGGERS